MDPGGGGGSPPPPPPPPPAGGGCTPASETGVGACPAGFTGQTATRRDYCADGSTASWGGWYETSSSCAPVGGSGSCTPSSQTQTAGCPAGYTGSTVQQNDYQCPSGTWSGWRTVSDSCVAIQQPPCQEQIQQQTVACPAGQTGTQVIQSTFQCPAGAWSGWSVVSNGCFTPPPPPPQACHTFWWCKSVHSQSQCYWDDKVTDCGGSPAGTVFDIWLGDCNNC